MGEISVKTNGGGRPTAPEGLRALADWFDAYDARRGETNDEIQRDLRRWADEWEQMTNAKAAN